MGSRRLGVAGQAWVTSTKQPVVGCQSVWPNGHTSCRQPVVRRYWSASSIGGLIKRFCVRAMFAAGRKEAKPQRLHARNGASVVRVPTRGSPVRRTTSPSAAWLASPALRWMPWRRECRHRAGSRRRSRPAGGAHVVELSSVALNARSFGSFGGRGADRMQPKSTICELSTM